MNEVRESAMWTSEERHSAPGEDSKYQDRKIEMNLVCSRNMEEAKVPSKGGMLQSAFGDVASVQIMLSLVWILLLM